MNVTPMSRNPSASESESLVFFYPLPVRRPNPKRVAMRVPVMPPSKPMDELAAILLVLTILGAGIAGWYGFWRAILWIIAHV